MLDLDRLAATPVSPTPFAHIVVPHFIPPAALADVVADLPDIKGRGSFPTDAVKVGPRAQAMLNALEGPAFREAVAAKFNLDLSDAPTMMTLRGNSGAKDGQIHCDSIAKRVTILLYLNPAHEAWARNEGCLRLLRGPDDLENYEVEVPPIDGTLLVFPNGPTTWHGHKQFIGRRYVVQLNYMTTDMKARSEMRRHHVSAFVKRIMHAA
jgi:hypothetical protein